jgi:hypothetical protein
MAGARGAPPRATTAGDAIRAQFCRARRVHVITLATEGLGGGGDGDQSVAVWAVGNRGLFGGGRRGAGEEKEDGEGADPLAGAV